MKRDRVDVTYGGTLNLGNYQSAKISVSLGAELELGDDPAEVSRVLFDEARAMVQERAAPLIKQKRAMIDGVFSSLPADVRSKLGLD